MIIGSEDFTVQQIVNLKDDYDAMCAFMLGLVPDRYKHVDAIYHNQRYYANMRVLSDKTLPLKVKQQVSAMLTRNIRVVGWTDIYITCRQMERKIDMNKVDKYYEGDKYEQSSRFSTTNRN